MKTKEELAALKKEVEAMNAKLAELSEEELAQVVGGSIFIALSKDSIQMTQTSGGQEDYHYDKGILTIPIH